MTHLQALINIINNACEIRITINDNHCEVWLWTHPNPANGTQTLIEQITRPTPELAALDLLDQLADLAANPAL